MAEGDWVIEVGDERFEADVIARSRELPVVVDFWAPWCGPCRTLGPTLEGLAREFAGAFLLAKVNVDEAPQVAGRFEIRSIPTVLGFRDGRVSEEFVGAQPEPAVRAFLEKLLPGEAEALAREGEELAVGGHENAAEERFRAALDLDGREPRALLGLARLLGPQGGGEEALALLERIPGGSPLVAEGERLAAAIRTGSGGAEDDLEELRRRVAAQPEDRASRLALGRALAARSDHESALSELLECVRRDPGFEDGAARKAMLDLFEVLGADHPLTERFRSELARVLFR